MYSRVFIVWPLCKINLLSYYSLHINIKNKDIINYNISLRYNLIFYQVYEKTLHKSLYYSYMTHLLKLDEYIFLDSQLDYLQEKKIRKDAHIWEIEYNYCKWLTLLTSQLLEQSSSLYFNDQQSQWKTTENVAACISSIMYQTQKRLLNS